MSSTPTRYAVNLGAALLVVIAVSVACGGLPISSPSVGGSPTVAPYPSAEVHPSVEAQAPAPLATGYPSPAAYSGPAPYPAPNAYPAPAPYPAPTTYPALSPYPAPNAYPAPSPYLAASPTPPPTSTAVVSPTATPPIACGQVPIRGFGKVWQEQASVAVRIGCPMGRESGIPAAEQFFEHGLMMWRGDTREIYVLRKGGGWSVYHDTWQEGATPAAGSSTPPAGLLEPVSGLGKVWREQTGVRAQLGWATVAARSYQGAIEGFASGTMFWSDAHVIYVLYADGAWQQFQDTFTG